MPPAAKVISAGAAKQDLIQSPTSDYSNAPSDETVEEQAEEKRKEEPHVKFAGETPGQEIDRVKAQLGRKNASAKAGEEPVTSPVEAEARGRTTERRASGDEDDEAEKEGQAGQEDRAEADAAEKSEKGGTQEMPVKPAETTPTTITEDKSIPSSDDQTQTAAEHVTSTDKNEGPSGTTTQEQPPAEAVKAGESVAD